MRRPISVLPSFLGLALSAALLTAFMLACALGGGGGSGGGGTPLPVGGVGAGTVTASASLSLVAINPSAGIAADGVAKATITVTVKDAAGSLLAGQAVRLSATGSGNTITQPAAVTDAAGVAAGSLASVVGETKIVSVTINAGTSSAVTLTQQPAVTFTGGVPAGTAVKVGFTVQPSDTATGGVILPAVKVAVQDAAGATVTSSSASITLAIGTNPGAGTMSGTTTATAVSGVATFSNLSINAAGSGYTLAASSGGLSGATSVPFNVVNAATPSKLAFVAQPTDAAVGAAISPAVQVAVQDASGITAPSATNVVTVAIGTNAGGGTLSGTMTVAAVSGVATFPDLKLSAAGNGYTLVASAAGLTSATSGLFNVTTVGAATKLAFTAQPSNTQAGSIIAPAVQVSVQDAAGVTVPSASNAVTVALGSNPGSGTMTGTTTVSAANGVASFGDLKISAAGNGYTLSAAASGLSGTISGTFNVTAAPAGAATKLAFTVQPSNTTAGSMIAPAIQVAVQDAAGATVAGAANSVTLAIATNPGSGSMTGTASRAAVAGVATFSDIAITKAGLGYTLSAAATGLTTATSAPFDVAANTKATGPRPVNNAVAATRYPIFSWNAVPNATGYDLYLDKGVTPPTTKAATAQTGVTYIPSTLPLDAGATYYWRVDAIVSGSPVAGDVWRFDTGTESPATIPQTPNPATAATGLIRTPLLTWDAVTGATAYDVLLDTGSGLTVVSAAQAARAWTPATPLAATTAHQWRVDSIHPDWKSRGSTWTFTTGNPAATHLLPAPADQVNDIWVTGAGAAVAVTDNGGIKVLASGVWSPRTSTVTVNLRGVWYGTLYLFGAPVGNAYVAVGDSGTVIYSQNGSTAWTALPVTGGGTTQNLNDLWGDNQTQVIFAPGNGGTLVQITVPAGIGLPSAGLVKVPTTGTATTNDLLGVTGDPLSKSDAWVVGRNASTFRYDGTQWIAENGIVASGATGDLYDIAMLTSGDLYVAGVDQVWHTTNRGASWQKEWAGTGVSGEVTTLRKIWAATGPSAVIWAVGDVSNGTTTRSIVLKKTGTNWAEVTHPTIASLSALMGASQTEVYAGGSLGHIIKFDGTAWSSSAAPSVANLQAVWGINGSSVWAVGDGGDVVYFNGSVWARQTSNTANDLKDIEGSGGSNVYAVGANATCIRYDGTNWTSEAIAGVTNKSLWGVAVNSTGQALAVGEGGAIISRLASSWAAASSGVTSNLYDVAWLTNTSAVAVGAGGTILHFDGTNWAPKTSGVTVTLTSVAGSAANRAYAVGASGTVLFWDGTAWTAETTGQTATLSSVALASATEAYVAGPDSPTPTAPLLLLNGGGGWANVQPLAAPSNPLGIWAESGSTLWACGQRGTIWKFTK
ncbi:MAG: Ig-like domain-containing protein [Planctomycetes bacterium]|nr:Ig-like domain-containing protein [Planctomycetota bacterium]